MRIVLKIGGNEIDDAGFLSKVTSLVSRLQKENHQVVVVHGGGKEITGLLKKLGIETGFVNGMRYTDAQSLDATEMVLSGGSNKRLVRTLQRSGISALGASGVDGSILVAEKIIRQGEDLGLVGDVSAVNVRVVENLIRDFVLVLSPISLEKGSGDSLNVNADYAAAAQRCKEGGLDGCETVTGGHLIGQFLSPRTNRRTDAWGGSPENRRRFAVETVRAVREAAGPAFIVIYRISVLDLVEDGQTWDEVTALAREVEAAGASILNLGIGWHEARVPTIVTSVPRAAFASYAGRLKEHVTVPVVATNRINMPDVAEAVLFALRQPRGCEVRELLIAPATEPSWP